MGTTPNLGFQSFEPMSDRASVDELREASVDIVVFDLGCVDAAMHVENWTYVWPQCLEDPSIIDTPTENIDISVSNGDCTVFPLLEYNYGQSGANGAFAFFDFAPCSPRISTPSDIRLTFGVGHARQSGSAGPQPNEQDCNTTLPRATIDVLQSRQWLCKQVATSTKGAVIFNYTALQFGELPQIVVDEKHNKQLVPDKVVASFRYALTNLEQPMTLEFRPPDILNQLNTTEEELQNVMTRIFHDAPNTSLDELLNTDLFLDLTQTYYQRLGSQVMRFAYSVDDNTVVEGSAIRNEARLIVQTVPVRVIDGVLAACILLVSYILFRLRKSTALPCDPHRLGGLLLILRRQPQARRIFLRTGYFGVDQLYTKVNPSTDATSTQPNDARSRNERTAATDDPNHSNQAEGRQVRKIDHKVLVREWWRPLTITIPVRASMFLLTNVVIIALQIL